MVKALITSIIYFLPFAVLAQADISRPQNNSADTVEKLDLIDIARSIVDIPSRKVSADDGKRVYFSFLPISSAGATNGKMLVTSTTAAFYLGAKGKTNISSINFTPYLNFKGRYGLPISSNIWLRDNSFNIVGDTRILIYPQYTWGLGGGQASTDKYLVDYKYLRFYQSALKRITSYFFAGIGYNLDSYLDMESDNGTGTTLRQFTNYRFGTQANQNAFSSGPTFNLLYDTRDNSINPMPGCYANVIYRYSMKAMGSNENWQSLYVDVRKYHSLTKTSRKNMLAFWFYYWTSLTAGTPYLNLPAIGMETNQRSGRGIEQNRYRGQNLLYFETEYRRDLTENGLLGFVLFANINSASQPNSRQFRYFNPAGGGGLRIKFNKKSDTNVGIDYGISRDYSSIRINLGETF